MTDRAAAESTPPSFINGLASVDRVAAAIMAAEYDEEAYPYERASKAEKDQYRNLARAAMRVCAAEVLRCRDWQKEKCCDNCRCVGLADSVAVLGAA